MIDLVNNARSCFRFLLQIKQPVIENIVLFDVSAYA